MQIFSSYTGPDFLIFYGVMLALCVGLVLGLRALLRPEGVQRELTDFEELAVLAGGRTRLTGAALTRLFVDRSVKLKGKRKLTKTSHADPASGAGAIIASGNGDFSFVEASRALAEHAAGLDDRLVEKELLMPRDQRLRLRLFSVAPLIVLAVTGIYRQQAGMMEGEATGFLIALLGVTAIVTVLLMQFFDPRTKAGMAVLATLREQSDTMKRAPAREDAAFAVALFGTGVLVGTPFEPLNAMFRSSGSDGSGANGYDSGGGGGCGGGCGGCGG